MDEWGKIERAHTYTKAVTLAAKGVTLVEGATVVLLQRRNQARQRDASAGSTHKGLVPRVPTGPTVSHEPQGEAKTKLRWGPRDLTC